MRSLLLLFLAACSSGTLRAPVSDKNFDDSDDPGSNMMGTFPDASDAFVLDGQGKACTSQSECAAPLRCIFAGSLGCTATGTCAYYTDPASCASKLGCGCDDKDVPLCAPEGYAPVPVKSLNACGADAGTD